VHGSRSRVVTTAEDYYRTRSLWLEGVPGSLAPRPPLPGDVNCDVVIVGAGFTGLWTAYYLKRHRPDARVVVLEREVAGYGPSGRNGGWVSSGIAGSAQVYARQSGMDAVLRATQETYRTVDEIGSVVAREGIACGFVKAGALTVATTEPQRQRLLTGIRTARRLGLDESDVRLLQPSEASDYVRGIGLLAASFTPHCARINPARLARGLAEVCERIGVTIYERSEALEVGPGRVRCVNGTVRADCVLRATEAYTTQLQGQHRRFLPLYSFMIATEPLPTAVWDQLGWRDGLLVADRRHLFFYAQRTLDNRIAIGGRGAPYEVGSPIVERSHDRQVRARLESALRRHFPAAADAAITHAWSGPLAVPRDWCMSVTFDRDRRFGWAGGYSGHGVVAANIAGRTLADLALGTDSDLIRLPWVNHRSRLWEPEPLRFLASRAIVAILASADRHEDRTGQPARRSLLVAPFVAQP
jgi:glycine/D-amino acid oxidase-like deaminating enzyme